MNGVVDTLGRLGGFMNKLEAVLAGSRVPSDHTIGRGNNK